MKGQQTDKMLRKEIRKQPVTQGPVTGDKSGVQPATEHSRVSKQLVRANSNTVTGDKKKLQFTMLTPLLMKLWRTQTIRRMMTLNLVHQLVRTDRINTMSQLMTEVFNMIYTKITNSTMTKLNQTDTMTDMSKQQKIIKCQPAAYDTPDLIQTECHRQWADMHQNKNIYFFKYQMIKENGRCIDYFCLQTGLEETRESKHGILPSSRDGEGRGQVGLGCFQEMTVGKVWCQLVASPQGEGTRKPKAKQWNEMQKKRWQMTSKLPNGRKYGNDKWKNGRILQKD